MEIGKKMPPSEKAKLASKMGEQIEHGEDAMSWYDSFDSAEKHNAHSASIYPNPTCAKSMDCE